MRRGMLLIMLLLLFSAGRVAVMAQSEPRLNFGRPPSEAEIKAWDTLIDQEGTKLPKGQGTAVQGATLYAQRCAMCHGPNGEGTNSAAGVGPVLVGKEGDEDGGIKHLYFATTLFAYIHRAMPMHQEGTLSVDEAYSLSAFLLFRNKIIKENEVMNAETLSKVKMPVRDEWTHPSEEISG